MSERTRIVLRLNRILTLRELSRYSDLEMQNLKRMNIECAEELLL